MNNFLNQDMNLLVALFFAIVSLFELFVIFVMIYRQWQKKNSETLSSNSFKKPYSEFKRETLEKILTIYKPKGNLIIDGVFDSKIDSDPIVVYDISDSGINVFQAYNDDFGLCIKSKSEENLFSETTFREFWNVAYRLYDTDPDDQTLEDLLKVANKFVGGLKAYQNSEV